MKTVFHALVLNLHQPTGNLETLLETQDWEAKEILFAMDRIARSLWGYEDVGRVHLSVSGTLLETLAQPGLSGARLWHREMRRDALALAEHAHYSDSRHRLLSSRPAADSAARLGGTTPTLAGPGRHFSGDLISRVSGRPKWASAWNSFRCSSGWVIATCSSIANMSNPSRRCAGTKSAIVRTSPGTTERKSWWSSATGELSDAQVSGMDNGWFMQEVHERTQALRFSSAWSRRARTAIMAAGFAMFRRKGNFWGVLIGRCWTRCAAAKRRSARFHRRLPEPHGAHGDVRVRTGAWNTGWHHGRRFRQWTGSQAQSDALQRVAVTSQALTPLCMRHTHQSDNDGLREQLAEAHWRLLRAADELQFLLGRSLVAQMSSGLGCGLDDFERDPSVSRDRLCIFELV